MGKWKANIMKIQSGLYLEKGNKVNSFLYKETEGKN